MIHERRHAIHWLGPLVAAAASAASAWAQAPPGPLSPNEQATAVSLAEAAVAAKGLQPAPEMRLYFVGAELFRDKENENAGQADKLALVTHYRYEGDLAILTVVNLSQRAVVSVEARPHLPVGLAQAEFERAKELALADEAVKKALGPNASKVVVEALVIRAIAEKDPYFGRRVVRLLFKLGAGYLSEPIVNVDLTAGRVEILPPPAEAMPHH